MNAENHKQMARSQLRDIPVFLRNPDAMFESDITSTVRNEILARGIPALSSATGNTAFSPDKIDGFNMNTEFKPDDNTWGRNHSLFGQNWMHGDLKDMAYFYNFKLFEDVVRKGASK